MIFRTEIDTPHRQQFTISHSDGIVMLGSCFTDNVGSLLERDGFDVVYNPMGPLYNAASLHRAISLALTDAAERHLSLLSDDSGYQHCLDFASKYIDSDLDQLKTRLNLELDSIKHRLLQAKTVILTLGTAYVFELDGKIVGNCHKFPSNIFVRRLMTCDEVSRHLRDIVALLPHCREIIFTVSPIRHTADGLHGNQISKSTLLLAVSEVVDASRVHYFPSYEIMLDDLRDYRFYAADMKHPSPVAVDYIYDIFAKYYFTPQTVEHARLARKESLRNAHRQIVTTWNSQPTK